MVDETSEVNEEMEASLSTDIEQLKKQKRVLKTQTSKLYTKLLRLMSDEKCESEELLQGLEAYEEKQQETFIIIDKLILAYKQVGDERNAVKTEDELDLVTKDTNRDASTVKAYISAMVIKPKTTRLGVEGTAQSKELLEGVYQETASKFEADEVNSWRALGREWEAKPVQTGDVDRNLERLQIPKFDGDNRSSQVFGQHFRQSWTRQRHFQNIKC